jgi:hypothetical protein
MGNMRLVLDPRRKEDTILGYEWLEPVSYGYDTKGRLQTILCKGLMSDNAVQLVEVIEPELSEDLMMNYNIEEVK